METMGDWWMVIQNLKALSKIRKIKRTDWICGSPNVGPATANPCCTAGQDSTWWFRRPLGREAFLLGSMVPRTHKGVVLVLAWYAAIRYFVHLTRWRFPKKTVKMMLRKSPPKIQSM